MLLQSIKLTNFRQFRNESIDFAGGEDGKNVTIIIGENGTGKTTFAQAFFWCLYGETDFSDKSMLNKKVEMELRPGQEAKVQVELKLHHGEVDYTLIREQVYKKDMLNRIKPENTTFDMARKDASGNTSYIKKTQLENEVKNILPKELSKYFFFDGERIEKMSKDISTGKKATDFAEAVKGLLGLQAMYSALEHFNPRFKVSVLSSYEASYNAQSNQKIKEYNQIIERCKSEIEAIDTRREELDKEIAFAETRKLDKSVEIKEYAEGEKLQSEKEQLQKRILAIERSKSNTYKEICREFSDNLKSFFSISLMSHAMKLLSDKDFTGKDIPYMRAETIEYLLKQKVCICGTHLDEGTIPCDKVKELIDFLPPQSISASIGDFKTKAGERLNQHKDVYGRIREKLEIISQQDADLEEEREKLTNIEGKLNGGDTHSKVRAINSEIRQCEQLIRKFMAERDEGIARRARRASELQTADTARSELALLDEKNRKIEIYKACATRIYHELQKEYYESEKKIRERLQTTINDIFKQIYDGGLYLTIDEKYHISVYATDYDGDVETSTAQSISVIFAFITGIIKMARDNRKSDDEDAKLLSSEPYPLVMDAPLSAFDKRRIKTVCEALPQTAEQVIIFIKDTDGDLAEKYLGERIGSRHRFDKKDEFETVLM